jgi:septal ring factor EnvC (AmiA/AmiB activator)
MSTPLGRREQHDLNNIDFSFVGTQNSPALKITKKQDDCVSTLVVYPDRLNERDQNACVLFCLEKVVQQQSDLLKEISEMRKECTQDVKECTQDIKECAQDIKECTRMVEKNNERLEICTDTVKGNNRARALISGISSISSHSPRVEEVDDDSDKKSFIDRAIDCFTPPVYFIGGLLMSAAKGVASFFAWSVGK